MGPGRVLVTDLDGTLLGDAAAIGRFVRWLAPRRASHRLVYATGRGLESVQAVIATSGLPVPDAIVTSVGTGVYAADGSVWPGWPDTFEDWDAGQVVGALRPLDWLERQPTEFQTPLKVSYDVHGLSARDAAMIEQTLADRGLQAKLVYSSGLHLDIMPSRAGKGLASRFLTESWAIPASNVLAFGDSGNDRELLTSGFKGTVVGNALPEILAAVGPEVYCSPEPFADGILDGIRHWSALG